MSTVRARHLRNTMTEPEVMLWSRLKRLRESGYHFRRQAPFKGYYLDFVCFNHRLVIELDGSQHAEGMHALNDRFRDGVVEREGFTVLRYPNAAVRHHLSEVVEDILRRLIDQAPVRESRVGRRA